MSDASPRADTVAPTVPSSLVAALCLTASVAGLGATFVISDEIYRFYCLGLSNALLAAAVFQLVTNKVLIWPARLALVRRRMQEPPAES
ncbi:MAG: hypothetical protein H6983_15745 [Ectothiorhodospiraceae bacterium]|nr:hypothetical protein [Ectothiorhodospiraceae bacterium]